MSEAHSFLAVSSPDARVLILGSMPGLPSLAANEYYANPRNAFWRIMATIFDFDPAAPYRSRLASLQENHIALWDVIESCYRAGSLDSAIQSGSVKTNDFAGFFSVHRQIETVYFNGAKAEQIWNRHVLPGLHDQHPGLNFCRLPSTSPAHAAMRYQEKLKTWRQIKRAMRSPDPDYPAA